MDSMSGGLDAGRLQKKVTAGSCVRILHQSFNLLTRNDQARKGINPFTKEPTIFKAKPARKVVRARPVKAVKDLRVTHGRNGPTAGPSQPVPVELGDKLMNRAGSAAHSVPN
jgi:hypothetical protein